jgi:hypothetical protein
MYQNLHLLHNPKTRSDQEKGFLFHHFLRLKIVLLLLHYQDDRTLQMFQNYQDFQVQDFLHYLH